MEIIMAHTNSTTNYALPQFIGSDKPAWLTDVNNAYSAIDTAIKSAADAASGAAATASSAAATAGSAQTAAGNAQTTASNAATLAGNNATAIASLQTALNDLTTIVNALNNARHIVSVTNESGWSVTRYSDGWIHADYKGSVTFQTAGVSINGWYRQTQQITLPFSVTDGDAFGTGANNGRLLIVAGMPAVNKIEAQMLSGASLPANLTVTGASIIVEGYEQV